MSFTFGYPKDEQQAVMVILNADVEELPAAMPLGTLLVVLPQKPVN